MRPKALEGKELVEAARGFLVTLLDDGSLDILTSLMKREYKAEIIILNDFSTVHFTGSKGWQYKVSYKLKEDPAGEYIHEMYVPELTSLWIPLEDPVEMTE